MKHVLLVKYGEIALRGNNRYIFEANILRSIKNRIKDLGDYSVTKEQGRLLVELIDGDVDYETIIPIVIKIFGIVGVCPCVKTENQEVENLKALALLHMREAFNDKTISFKVETKRSNKKYPLESREVSRQVGGYLLHNMDNLSVDVHKPDVTVNVELRNDAYIYSKVIKAYGGLPTGSTGKAVLLLSGGIDSPVAGWMIAKRGVEVEGVYFHSPPYTSERAKQKVIDLANIVAGYTGNFKLHIVPFTDIQLYLCENTQPEKLTLFLKRCMLKVSERIAKNVDAQALITGDSIGQVASQTMKALEAVSSATDMTILRPLSGTDKQEIVDLAKRIGSYEISIRPYEDCCTIFVAKHPETKPKKELIEKIEKNLTDLEAMIDAVMDKIEVIEM